MKKIFVILLVIAVIISGVFLYIKSRKFNLHLKTIIKKSISTYIGQPVEIGRIKTDIFNSIILSNVKVTESVTYREILTIKKIKIRYSLLKLIKKAGNISQIIRDISFFKPELTIHYTDGKIKITGLEKVLSQDRKTRTCPIPPWKLNFVNGNINIYLKNSVIKVRNFDGNVFLSGYPEIHAKTSFEILDLIKEIKIESNLHILKQDFKALVTGKNLQLKQIGEILAGDMKFSFDSGLSNVYLHIEGNLKNGGGSDTSKNGDGSDTLFLQSIRTVPILRSLQINGEIKIQNAVSGIYRIPEALINVSSDRLKIEKGSLMWGENSLNITGIIKNYLEIPEIMLEANGRISASQLLEKPMIKGEFEVAGAIKGSLNNLTAIGNLFMDSGDISNIHVSQLKTEVSYENGNLRFGSGQVCVADGNLMWEGSWSETGEINIRLLAENLCMSKITGNKKINGKFNSNFAISGNINSPVINANATLQNFIIPGRKFEHLTIKAEYSDLKFILNGFTLDGNYTTHGKFTLSDDNKNINIEEFVFNGQNKEKLKIGGGFSFSPFSTKLIIEALNVDTVNIPGLRSIYGNLEGAVNFRGNFVFNEKETALNGLLQTAELSIGDAKYFLACNIDAMLKNETKKIKISDINLNNYLKGLLEFESAGDKTHLKKSSITVTTADIKELTVLVKRDFRINSGTLDGIFQFKENKGAGKFFIQDLKALNADFGNISCLLTKSGDEIQIKELISTKDAGSFFMHGDVYPIQDIKLNLKGYDLNKRKFDGGLHYIGGWSTLGKYEFKANGDIKLNKKEWPGLSVNGSYINEELNINLNAGDKITGELIAKFDESNSIESDIWVKEFQLQKVLDAFGVSLFAQGLVSGSIKTMGKVKSPLFYFKGTLTQGEWNNIPLSMKLSAEYQAGELNIEKLKGALGKDGYIEVTGGIDSSKCINSVFKIRKFDMSLLKEAGISGSLDTEVRVSGNFSKPVIDIEFDLDNRIKGTLTYSENVIKIKEVEAFYNEGALNLDSGKINLTEPGKLDTDVHSTFKNLKIGPFSILGTAKITGIINTKPLSLRLKIVPENLLINRFNLNTALTAEYNQKTLKLNAEQGIKAEILFNLPENIEVKSLKMSKQGKVIDGNGIYTKERISASIHAENIQINKIIKLFDSPVDYYGKANFDLNVEGTAEAIEAHGQLSIVDGMYKNIKIDSFSSSFSYADGNLKLMDTILSDPRFIDIEVAGTIGEINNLNINVHRFSLSVLENMSDEISKAAGYFKGKFNLRGSVKKPVITGGINLEGGTVVGKDIIGKIRDIECRIVSQQSRFNFSKLKAKWKPGSITGDGYIDVGVKPFKINITIHTEGEKGVSVKIPYLDIPQSTIFGRFLTLPSHGEIKGKVNLYNIAESFHLKSDITLKNTHFTYPPAKSSKKPASTTFFDNIILDIDLSAGESVWYENTYARVKVQGNLNFKQYPGKSIIINGTITSNEGELTYFNRDYRVKEANLKFEDTVEYLDAVAVTDIQRKMEDEMWEDDVIEIIISPSRVADITPRFNSGKYADKTSSEEAMELTIAGVELEGLSQDERNFLLRQEILRAIDANLTSPLVKNILKRTELIDVAKVDVQVEMSPEGINTFMFESAGIELGRYFTDRFYMGYYMEVGGAENKLRLSHELDVLYRLQGSQFLRGRVSEKEKFLGFEQRIKF